MIAGHRLFAGQHHTGLDRLLANMIGDDLIKTDPTVEDGAFGERHAGKQIAGLGGVDLAGRLFIEQTVDNVDLSFRAAPMAPATC